MSRPLKVLQFGASGQLARELLARAAGANLDIEALGRADVDLTDAAAVSEAVRNTQADLVINAAAYTAVDRAESEEALAFAVNAAAPEAMARACAERGLPLVYVSTDYVFDGEKAGAWIEDDTVCPINAYGRSKAAGEAAIAEAGARAMIVRTSWLFSPYGANFVKTMLKLARDRPRLSVVDDQHGRPTAVGDLADFILSTAPRLVDGDDCATGAFHFAGAGTVTWRGFAEVIVAMSSGPRPAVDPIATADYPTPARRPRNSELDCGKIERVFGVRPRPWRDGLAETLERLAMTETGV
jgi:dTDP-4-dehydrorhamnose reductase